MQTQIQNQRAAFEATLNDWVTPENLRQVLASGQLPQLLANLTTPQQDQMVALACSHESESVVTEAVKALWPHARSLSTSNVSALLKRSLQLTEPQAASDSANLAVQQCAALTPAQVATLVSSALAEPETARGAALFKAVVHLVPTLDQSRQSQFITALRDLPSGADRAQAVCSLAPRWRQIVSVKDREHALAMATFASDDPTKAIVVQSFTQQPLALDTSAREALMSATESIEEPAARVAAVAGLCGCLSVLSAQQKERVLLLADAHLQSPGAQPIQLALASQIGHLDEVRREALIARVAELDDDSRAQALLSMHGEMSLLTGAEEAQLTHLTLATELSQATPALFVSLAAQIPRMGPLVAEALVAAAEDALSRRGSKAAALASVFPSLDGPMRLRTLEAVRLTLDDAERCKGLEGLAATSSGPLAPDERQAMVRIAFGFTDQNHIARAFKSIIELTSRSAGRPTCAACVHQMLKPAPETQRKAAIEAIAQCAHLLSGHVQRDFVEACFTLGDDDGQAARVRLAAPAMPHLLSVHAQRLIEITASIQNAGARRQALDALCSQAGQLGGPALDRLVDLAIPPNGTAYPASVAPPAELAKRMDSMQAAQRGRIADLAIQMSTTPNTDFVLQVIRGIEHLSPAKRTALLDCIPSLREDAPLLALDALAEGFHHLSLSDQGKVLKMALSPKQPGLPPATRLSLGAGLRRAEQAAQAPAAQSARLGVRAPAIIGSDAETGARKLPARRQVQHIREAIAAPVYANMPHPTPIACPGQEASVASISTQSMTRLRGLLGSLTPQEHGFIERFMQTRFYATHATGDQAVKPDHSVSLFSRDKLLDRDIEFDRTHTTDMDLALLKNSDFVFFSLEAGDAPKKPGSHFGPQMFRFAFDDPKFTDTAWLSTADTLVARTPDAERHVHGLGIADYRYLRGRDTGPEGVFAGPSMLIGLALSIVKDCRELSPRAQTSILATPGGDSINNVLNGLYRPEVKVPRHFFGWPSDGGTVAHIRR